MKLSNVNGYESPNFGCSCKKVCFKMDQADQIGTIVQGLMSTRKTGKAKIKLEIEFSD